MRYEISIKHLLRFFENEKHIGAIYGEITVSHINNALVERFIAFRKDEGVGGHTISRDLAALRGSLNFAFRNELIDKAPFVKDVDAKDKAKSRDLVYSMEEVAALLEVAWERPDRRHVFLYIMIALSTCGRSQAILELQDYQIDRGLIYFLDPDRRQTSKRRSIVPIAPTLAVWLDDAIGKVIKYQAVIGGENRSAGITLYLERECFDLGNSFERCLLQAGISRPVYDAMGGAVWNPPRHKLGETDARPRMKGLGTPNTLRHTIITEMHRRGVPEAQIDAAAGHVGEGTGKRNYRHLRPGYLSELIDAIEDYWNEMRRFTTVHLRDSVRAEKTAALRPGRSSR